MAYPIRRAAVIGSGTMGGAIAALLANAGVPVDLLDITPDTLTPDEQARGLSLTDAEVRNRIVQRGWEAVLRSRPPALADPDRASLVRPGNLEDDFDRLREADWILEAVVERLDIKQGLMARLDAVRGPQTIVSTNTSGIPIRAIAGGCSPALRQHFLGTHFFNPPRYLKLVEVIPGPETLPEVLSAMARFAADTLEKGVVICKDTPNFIANRFLSIAGSYEVIYALEHGYTVEEIDLLAGPLIGRPRSGVFRLLDLIGLDVMAHVNSNLYEAIPHDEARHLLRHAGLTRLMDTLVQNGWLGNKAGQGFYRMVTRDGEREFWALDLQALDYAPPRTPHFESAEQASTITPTTARIQALISGQDRGAQFVRAATFHRFSYAARCIPEIADLPVSIDRAIRWGFAEELGPFELWDALGVAATAAAMESAGYPVPAWVHRMLGAGFSSFYRSEGETPAACYNPEAGQYVPI